MKRLLYLISLILAVMTAIGYVIGKGWEEEKIVQAKEMSETERLNYLRQKASNGDANALYEIGVYYEMKRSDYLEAQQWFRAAASRGQHPGAQYKLGKLYFTGRGVENDLAVAMEWFRKAAAQADPRGYFFLGIAARDGWERRADLVDAYKWIWLANYGHDIVFAEDDRYDTLVILGELEETLSQFNIEKAKRLAEKYPKPKNKMMAN